VFSLTRPTESQIQRQLAAASEFAPRATTILSVHGTQPEWLPPRGFAFDRSQSLLGHGEAVFNAAKSAFLRWAQFDLGWTRVANPDAPIEVGRIVAVEVKTLGLWSLNLSRIVETIDTLHDYGFVYSTTEFHVEQGEELFLLRLDPATGEVRYQLEAASRPRNVLARLGYPVTRSFQHRFARDSHRQMHSQTLASLPIPS